MKSTLPKLNSIIMLCLVLFASTQAFSQAGFVLKSSSNAAASVAPGGPGSPTTWLNPSNANTENGISASVSLVARNNRSYYLDITDFGFVQGLGVGEIPPSATISGIVVEVKMQSTGGAVKDVIAQIIKGGTATGTAHTSALSWPTTLSYRTYGNTSDLWGVAWTPADIAASNFGFRIQCKNSSKVVTLAEIDNVKITVYFNSAVYYSKSTGSLALLSTWGTNTDGTGSAPSSFISDGQIFKVRNRAATTLIDPLTITGIASKLTIGEYGATSVTIQSAVAAVVDVAASGTLILQNAAIPTLGSLDPVSTVNYNLAGTQTVSVTDYGNLTISNGNTKTLSADALVAGVLTVNAATNFTLNGNVIVIGNITNSGIVNGSGELTQQGSVAATISGTGTFNDLAIDNASGVTLSAGPMNFINYFRALNGAVANSTNLIPATGCVVNIEDGSLGAAITTANNYDVLYTSTANKTTSANELGAAGLRHVTMTLFDNTLTLTAGANFSAGGDLTLTTGIFNASTRTITLKGDLTNNSTLTQATSTFIFTGTNAVQNISGTGSVTFNNLTLNKGSGRVQLKKNVSVNANVALTAGILNTNNFLLTLNGTTAAFSPAITFGNAATTFISTADEFGNDGTSGGLQIQSIGTAGRTGNIVFPVGNTFTSYNPVRFNNSGTADNFTVLVKAGAPAGTIAANSVDRTWDISEAIPFGTTAVIDMQWNSTEEMASYTLFKPGSSKVVRSNGTVLVGAGNPLTPSGADPFNQSSVIPFTVMESFGVSALVTLLPVTFTSVSAKVTTSGTEVKWQNATEQGVRSYSVERSVDGINFITVFVQLPGHNNGGLANYTWVDAFASSATVYYRVKAEEVSGRNIHSSIVKVNRNALAAINIVPNPVINKVINLQFTAVSAGSYTVTVLNTNGQVITAASVDHAGGFSNQSIQLPASIPAGTYFVKIVSVNSTLTQKVQIN